MHIGEITIVAHIHARSCIADVPIGICLTSVRLNQLVTEDWNA